MNSRRRAREFALQALYAADLSGTSRDLRPHALEATLAGLWAAHVAELGGSGGDARMGEPATQEEVQFALELVVAVQAKLTWLDEQIQAASTNWRLSRMPIVDRNILRIGAMEILTHQDTPISVSINEGIELAKRFGTSDSRAFVNGILDRIAAEAGRGGRNKGR